MKTLLIVDDEDKICVFLERFFKARGFNTMTAYSGHEAIEKLNTMKPDYVLLDIRMPDISGLEILKMVKGEHPDTTVVMVTALDDQETAKAAFRFGASDYVTKPFGLGEQTWARAFFSAED